MILINLRTIDRKFLTNPIHNGKYAKIIDNTFILKVDHAF